MRWSQAFIPTLRDDPAEAEAISHKLLVRGGFIRQLSAGHYSMLPLGQRVRAKIDRIIRGEMDAIGGQQFHLPALHPAEIWKKSGRWDVMGDELFRLIDRKGADNALGMTHEEVFATLATEISSYRDLPQIWYQIQTKFRDEPRPKSGLLRVREFTMKDSYSLDLDRGGLDDAFDNHHAAYKRIFGRLGIEAVDVEASSGAMGGTSRSSSWSEPGRGGLDRQLPQNVTTGRISRGRYRACRRSSMSRARLAPGVRHARDQDHRGPGERAFPTSPARIDSSRPWSTSSMVRSPWWWSGATTSCWSRSSRMPPAPSMSRAAKPEEIKAALGALPGSLGAVGVTDIPIVVDEELRGRTNMVTGANRDDWHLRGVDIERDVKVARWASLRTVREGEPCPQCGAALSCGRGSRSGTSSSSGPGTRRRSVPTSRTKPASPTRS